jgi:hypothetical protein
MPDKLPPLPPSQRSYLGIGSCVLFVIATSSLFVVLALNWNSQAKISGLEIIVVGPFAVLVYIVGLLLGFVGLQRPVENPLSKLGALLNGIPLALVIILLAFSLVLSIGRSGI